MIARPWARAQPVVDVPILLVRHIVGERGREATARTTNATIVDRASLRTANLLLRKGTVSGARGQCRTRTVRLRVRASKRIPAFRGAPRHHAVSVNRSLPTPTRFPRLPERLESPGACAVTDRLIVPAAGGC